MGRYIGPSCKKCRRSREKLFLKGEKCFTAKCPLEKRNYPPGLRSGRPAKSSEYGRRLREKQKLRFFYGLSENQMRRAFRKASNQRGVTGHNLLSLFERRMDNVVYRIGLARSRKEARQLIKHGHFVLNERPVNVPSIVLGQDDVMKIGEGALKIFKDSLEGMKEKSAPEWLSFNLSTHEASVLDFPSRESIDVPVDEQLIVEYYSK